jgi:primosomal protein N'
MASLNQPQIISVLPATGIDRTYTYKCDDALAIGTYVKINFGRQEVVGVVWNDAPECDLPLKKIKAVAEVYDAPILSTDMVAISNGWRHGQ